MTNKENACSGTLWHTIDFVEACAFYRQFHTLLHLQEPDFKELHDWLCMSGEVPEGLRQLYLDLIKLRRPAGKMKPFTKTFLKRSINYYINRYCRFWLPQYSKTEYESLPPTARVDILRHLQDNVLVVRLLKYPHDMCDQQVGTDSYGMRYMLQLWAKPDLQYSVYKVDQQNNVLIGRNCHYTSRAQLNELIQYLNHVRRRSNEAQTFEQKQLVTFLTLLLPHFPE